MRRPVKGDLAIQFGREALSSYSGLELLRRYVRGLALSARLHQALGAELIGGDWRYWPAAGAFLRRPAEGRRLCRVRRRRALP